MRLSSRRFEGNSMWHRARSGGARPLRGSRLDRYPPESCSSSASCHATYMIAPTDRRPQGELCKLPLDAADCPENQGQTGVTGSLAESYCCPTSAKPTAPLNCEKRNHCVGPVLSVPDSSAPAPRGRRDRALSQGSENPHHWANGSWSFFFWEYRPGRRPARRSTPAALRLTETSIGFSAADVKAAPSIGPGLSRLAVLDIGPRQHRRLSREMFSSGHRSSCRNCRSSSPTLRQAAHHVCG